jgi:hypothetical protein
VGEHLQPPVRSGGGDLVDGAPRVGSLELAERVERGDADVLVIGADRVDQRWSRRLGQRRPT